ncbi:type II secretion system protein D [Abditibacteriota bacterium]|nr:type II secretion system protein D [Abditibacteriota bacterium]
MNSSPYFAPPSRGQTAPRVLIRAVSPEPLFSLRRRRALCIGFLLVWPAFYAARSANGASLPASPVAATTLRVGQRQTLPLAPGAKWFVEEGIANALVEGQDGSFSVRGIASGNLRMRVEKSDGSVERLAFRFVASPVAAPPMVTPAPVPVASAAMTSAFDKSPFLAGKVPTTDSPATRQLMSRRAQSQIAPSTAPSNDPLSQIPAIPSNLGIAPLPTAPASGSPAPGVNPATAPAGFPNGGARLNPPAGFPNGLPNFTPTLPATVVPSNPGILTSPADSAPPTTPALPELPTVTATPRPSVTRPVAPAPRPRPAPVGGQVVRPLPPVAPSAISGGGGSSSRPTRISPVLPSPSRNTTADVPYHTTPRLPRGVSVAGPRPGIQVTQGLARLVTFPENILSVFFSDPNVMDARAINARTIAVTGVGIGNSTLAVFTSRYPGDAVGHANIYRVQTAGKTGATPPATSNNPQVVEAAISAALGDPRVRTTVVRLPNGSLAARLTGTVRNAAEVQGAETTAAFFVDRDHVISSLYADTTAPSIDAVMNGTASADPQTTLQSNLRLLTGNSTIELVSLPGGLALKARAESPQEAEAILRVLPTINQPVLPFIVVSGMASPQNPYYTSQALQGEDRVLTERLQAVTGVTTVTAVRAAPNSVAIYGTVPTRGDYETVKRYAAILGQAAQGTLRPTGIEGALPAYDPAGGYLRTLGVQMFVRILDPMGATVRNVTVETNVVEISRTALRNLGASYGSAPLTNETVSSDGTVTRTISPTFNQGVATAGNGFGGQGGFGAIDPFRVQLNALEQKGDARILASPNVRAVEGMPAQITIGGERPVPSAVATTGATAQSVEFRRYGVIISMRPTVSDDNTILLQIRADITQPDRTFEINLNGALIPGETVRSIDTSIAVRPGDVIVMGGLLTNEKRMQTSKVPILGDLPIIGSLFKSKRYENNETELAIFMTPRIDSLPASLTTQADHERMPGYPTLPSRQDSNSILFQNTTRAPG